MADDLGERSELPTPRRKTEARKDGNVARSQDLGGVVLLVAGTLLIVLLGSEVLGRFRIVMEAALTGDMLGNPLIVGDAATVAQYVGFVGARIALPMLLVLGVAAFLGQFIQVGWLITFKQVKPDLGKLDPIKGAKKLVSLTSLFKALMSIAKVAVTAVISVLTIYQYRDEIIVLAYLSPVQALGRSSMLVLDLAIRLLAVLLLLAIIDYAYQRWKHQQDLKMTKQEVKDEMKSVEGDPLVKRRRYRMQQTIAMQRINAAVPRADVIVTNPEHISIAIRYDAEQMNAPTVVAKGADYLALRIRQLGLLNNVPIVERPPLARALYKQVAVGQEVPPDFYHAVAEILAYVYQVEETMAG
ncbi:MAG: flagellar biosynthesis protein FlhB [Planctomycetes bacterium]|nr:flagellar biosynthesis protein FlhB [Planctomycetota bacterium]